MSGKTGPAVVVRGAEHLQFRGVDIPEAGHWGERDCNSPAHWEGETLDVFNSAGHPWRSGGRELGGGVGWGGRGVSGGACGRGGGGGGRRRRGDGGRGAGGRGGGGAGGGGGGERGGGRGRGGRGGGGDRERVEGGGGAAVWVV